MKILEEKYMKGDKPKIKLVPGVCIAGGAIRRWYSGEPQTADIDVFVFDKKVLNEFLALNRLIHLDPDWETDEIMIYSVDGQQLQIILDFGTISVLETIEKFDYTICQFALDHTGTIYATERAQCDVHHKRLRIIREGLRKGHEVNLMRRAMKYIKSGYNIDIETVKDIATVINEADKFDIENSLEFLSPDQEV